MSNITEEKITMNNLKKFLKINRVTIVAILIVAIISIGIGKLIVSCSKYKNEIENNLVTIAELEENIESYTIELDSLKTKKNDLEAYNKVLNDKNDELSVKNEKYKEQLNKYEESLSKYEQQEKASRSNHSGQVSSLDTGFRSWMPYTALRSGTSQYKVVHMASVNEYGILEYDDRAVVAVGFGWGLTIGETATVTTTNGSYKIVVGDWKAKCDTDSTNKVTTSNGCVVEFIVDRNSLTNCIKTTGSVSSVSKYSGKVLSITSDGSNILK